MAEDVIDNPEKHRFELAVPGGTALSYYKIDGDRVILTHTEVPQALSGQGIGSRLAHGVFELVKARGRKIVAKCPFMAAYAGKHPEYNDLVVG